MKAKISAVGNLSGRDNRSSFTGGTQFPTESSKQPAKASLNKSITVAEAGPAPLTPKARINYVRTSNKIPAPWLNPHQPKQASLQLPLQQYFETPKGKAELMLEKIAAGQFECLDSYYQAKCQENEDELKELFNNYSRHKMFL